MKFIGLGIGVALLSSLLVLAMVHVAVLDLPGHRSSHDRPTPKGGGVGVVAAFLLGSPLALWLSAGSVPGRAWAILGAVALLALVSWLDDLRQFPPLVKLAAQAAAAALVLAGIGPLPAHPALGLAIGFGWLMLVTNAVNFIDGLNGLASGSMALACLCIGLTAAAGPAEAGSLAGPLAWMLAAGLAGFLPFNYPAARIFLGDVGSQGAGLALAAIGLLRWQDHTPWSVLVMPLLLGGILYDVGFTLCRRCLAGEIPWQAHRGHLYQVASRSGMPAWQVALLHWSFVLWGGVLGRTLPVGPAAAIALVLLPQLFWTGFVVRRARRARIGRW